MAPAAVAAVECQAAPLDAQPAAGCAARAAAAAVGLALLASGCAAAPGGSGGAASGQRTAASVPGSQAPEPAGPTPSIIATMICRNEAIQEIDSALGATATVSSPTWADHLYSCTYGYPSGSMRLSVKELSNPIQTDAYFHQLAARMGDTGAVENLGQGAFHTSNGSIVARKDWKVLLVDVTGMPAQFGEPPITRDHVALTAAQVILACWSGD